jgi:hypothetical protein
MKIRAAIASSVLLTSFLTVVVPNTVNAAAKQKALKNKKGTVEITFNNYVINKGVSNSMF